MLWIVNPRRSLCPGCSQGQRDLHRSPSGRRCSGFHIIEVHGLRLLPLRSWLATQGVMPSFGYLLLLQFETVVVTPDNPVTSMAPLTALARSLAEPLPQ